MPQSVKRQQRRERGHRRAANNAAIWADRLKRSNLMRNRLKWDVMIDGFLGRNSLSALWQADRVVSVGEPVGGEWADVY